MITCAASYKPGIALFALICLFAFAGAVLARDPVTPPAPISNQVRQKLEGLTKVLRAHPNDLGTLNARASLYADSGRLQLALADLSTAIDNHPPALKQHLSLYILRAECFERLGQYQNAGRDVKTFMSTSPREAHWHEAYWYGEAVRILLEAGMYQECVHCADTYISSSQSHWTAYASRAISLAFLGKCEEATSDLADMQRPNFNIKELADGLLCTQQVIDMSVARIAAAVQANPKNQTTLLGQAVVEAVAMHFEKSVADSTAVLRLSPSLYEAFLVRALSQLSLKHNSEALKDIDQAIKLKPTSPLGYKVLEYYYVTISGVDELQADLHRRESSQPGNLTLLMAEAHGYKCSRNLEKERAIYENILKQNSKFAPALFARGELSHELGDLHSAVQYFSQGLLEDPTSLKGLKGRAACFLELADYRKALIDLDRVIKICDDPNAYLAREQCSSKLR